MTERKLRLRKLDVGALTIAALSLALAATALHAQASANAGGGAAQSQTAQPQPQTAPAQLPKFDVASVKAHKPEGMMMRAGMRLTPDGVSISGLPLSMLLHEAFELPEDRILNEPDWVNSARYDIEAKVDPADAPKLEKLTPKERMEMLLPLLEDRFGLKFHHETKVLEVYALVVAKGGPKLKATGDKSDEGADAAPLPLGGASGNGGVKLPRSATMMRISPEGMTMEGRDATAEQLAQAIATQLGSTVVNETGLKDKYDYTLTFAPEMGGRMMGMPAPPPGAGDSGAPPPPPQGPSIFSAVEEQLGLKLEAKKQPVDVIVIDDIEQPSAN
ncbi:MAG: TIGR03435 family protein [Terracidiphilus sp.]